MKDGWVDGGKERWMLLSSFSVLVLCTWLDSTVVESWDVYPGSLLLAFNAVSLLGLLVYCRLQTFELPSSAFVSIYCYRLLFFRTKSSSDFQDFPAAVLYQKHPDKPKAIETGIILLIVDIKKPLCVLKKEAAVQILGMCKNQRPLFISQKN